MTAAPMPIASQAPAPRPGPSVTHPMVGEGYRYATVGRRMLALLIDVAFVTVVGGVTLALSRNAILAVLCAIQAVALNWGWEACRGRTIGKAILGLCVVRNTADMGQQGAGLLPAGPWRALARVLITSLGCLVAIVAAFMLEWTSSLDQVRHRGLQDRLSGTAVIDTRVQYVTAMSDTGNAITDNTGTSTSTRFDSTFDDEDEDLEAMVGGILPPATAPTPSGRSDSFRALRAVPAAIEPSSVRPAQVHAGTLQSSSTAIQVQSVQTESVQPVPAAPTISPAVPSPVPSVTSNTAKPVIPAVSQTAMPRHSSGAVTIAIPTPAGTTSARVHAVPPALPTVGTSPVVPSSSAAPIPTGPLPVPKAVPQAVPQRPVPAKPAAAKQVAVLYFENGNGVHLDIPSRALLGRRPTSSDPNDVLVRVPDTTGTISRTHALLEIASGRMWVTDLESTNGTEILTEDGAVKHLEAGARTEIAFGTRIFLGSTAISVSLLRNREKK